jgi:hypothetical protein
MASHRSDSFADELLDELIPETLDWRRLVRDYPVPALLVAATGGFLLGRSRGLGMLGALTGIATQAMATQVVNFIDERG